MPTDPTNPRLRRVAVTGASGFIGRHLVSALIRGGSEVTALTRQPPASDDGGRLRWHGVDLLDPAGVEAVLEASGATTLFHLAGVRGGPHGLAECARVNVAGTASVLQAAVARGLARVVVAGSAQEYGGAAPPLREDTPIEPDTIYGATKAAAVRLAVLLHQEVEAPVVVVRPFNVYGPGQAPPMFVAHAVEAAVKGVPFKMSIGRQRRDFLYVDDLIDGLLAAASRPGVEGQIFNLASGEPTEVRAVAAAIWEITRSSAPLQYREELGSRHDHRDSWADVSAARDSLGWSPRTSLREGLQATVAALRAALDSPAGP